MLLHLLAIGKGSVYKELLLVDVYDMGESLSRCHPCLDILEVLNQSINIKSYR